MNAAELNSYSAVALVLRKYKVPFEKERLIRLCINHPDFPTLLSVSDLLKKFGFKVAVRRLDISVLASWTTFPALIFFNAEGGKLMLLEGLDDSHVHLADPVKGKVRMGRGYFSDNWGGLIFDLQKVSENQDEAATFTKGRVACISASCIGLLWLVSLGAKDCRPSDLPALLVCLILVAGGLVLARLRARSSLLKAYQALGILPDGNSVGTGGSMDTHRAIARTIVNFKYDPAKLKAIRQQERTMAPLFDDMHVYALGRPNVDKVTVVADPRYHRITQLIRELILISDVFEDVEVQLVFCYVAPFPEYLKALDLFEKFPEKDLARSGPGLLRENFLKIEVDRWTDQQRQLIRNHLNWGVLSGVRSRLQIFFNDRSVPDYYQTDDLLYLVRKIKTVR